MRSLDTAVGDFGKPEDPRPVADPPTEVELSRLSLVQALRDFEVANGRVTDLTERLIDTAQELLTARQSLEELRAERDDLADRLDDVTGRYQALMEAHQRTLERKSVKLGEAIWAARRSVPGRRRAR